MLNYLLTPLPKDYREISLSSLAYIGDAIFEVYVRSTLLAKYPEKPNKLHRRSIRIVKAEAQANLAKLLLAHLYEDEKDILLRGKNTDMGTYAKHASPLDYRWATGLECLIAYLAYHDQERLSYVLNFCQQNWQE